MVKILVRLGAVVCLGASVYAAPDYNADVDDVRAMMEGVRTKTEGVHTTAADGDTVVATKKASTKAFGTEQFPGLADELMNKADKIQKELNAPQVTKKTALVKEDQSSSHDRAARFFATHGMLNVGQMLGDQLSADEQKKAQEEAASDQRRLRGMGVAVAAAASATEKVKETSTASSITPADAEMDALANSDDEEDEAEKKRWAAVDALKHRRPPM